jgi:hypothetical protein
MEINCFMIKMSYKSSPELRHLACSIVKICRHHAPGVNIGSNPCGHLLNIDLHLNSKSLDMHFIADIYKYLKIIIIMQLG